ncbi:MAG: ATP-binding protein [Kiritimatiellia bacterium]
MILGKQRRTTIRVIAWTTREWRDLTFSLVLAFAAAVVGVAINFSQWLAEFFRPHANQHLVQFSIQFIFVWLVMLLGMSYLRWRKAAMKNAELTDVVDSINPDVLLVIDQKCNILMTNVSILRMFGYSPEEVIGKQTDLLYYDRRRMPNVKHEIYDALQQNSFHIGWATGKRKDGRIFPVEIITGTLQQHGGCVLLLRDISERMNAEHLLREREMQLQQAQKMETVGLFAGGIAHNFNNLLMGIMGYADLCRQDLSAEHHIRGHLDEIVKLSERSAVLIRQLLTFARKQIIAPRVLDLNDTVTSIHGMLQQLIGSDIHIDWKPCADLRPVKFDQSQIDHILINLCANARDAIAGVGKIVIETSNCSLDQAYCDNHAGTIPGEYVLLTISDTGCGMSKEVLAKIFEPFFTTKDIGKGTGLGLATVYGIVRQNNGYIDVYSAPGKGTTFKIYLSLFVGEAEKTTVARATEVPSGRGETILLVEDEASLRILCTQFLISLGYKVLPAENPAEAIDLFARNKDAIQLLLTDMIMPGMNGRDLAEQLTAGNPYIKVLYMSGYAVDVIAERGLLNEGMSFIQKPVSRIDMAHKVREVLDVGNS